MHKLENKNRPGYTWKWSNEVLKDAVNKIIETVNYNHDFDVPYVGGPNKEGTLFYLDKDMPYNLEILGKKYDLKKYVLVHEAIEESVRQYLKLEYLLAHQIALRVEQQAVLADGLSWNAYNEALNKYIKEDAFKNIKVCPRDLDLAPYEDEKDYHLIEKIKSKMA